MSATPIVARRMVLEMKYGKIMRVSPQTSGTTAFCFLPYMKKPSPTEPKSKPQRNDGVLNAATCRLTVLNQWKIFHVFFYYIRTLFPLFHIKP